MLSKLKRAITDPDRVRRYVSDHVVRRAQVAWGLTKSTRWNPGTNVFELDWDLLVVLDTCRPDALRQVAEAERYSFAPDDVGEMTSVASATKEWTALTFTEAHRDAIADTALVSANGWPHRVLAEGFRPDERLNTTFAPTTWDTVADRDLGEHVRAWRYGEGRAGYSDQPQADAETVTDVAIRLGRDTDFDRYIVHYIEPHYPFAAAARKRGESELSDVEQNPFRYLRNTGDRATVWDLYLDELRFGLDHVEVLLENFDVDRVVITADHGEAFGEDGFYGHTLGIHAPAMRRVPLVRTRATDTRSREPTIRPSSDDIGVREHLESLGYLGA